MEAADIGTRKMDFPHNFYFAKSHRDVLADFSSPKSPRTTSGRCTTPPGSAAYLS
jgi:hypothetical protein